MENNPLPASMLLSFLFFFFFFLFRKNEGNSPDFLPSLPSPFLFSSPSCPTVAQSLARFVLLYFPFFLFFSLSFLFVFFSFLISFFLVCVVPYCGCGFCLFVWCSSLFFPVLVYLLSHWSYLSSSLCLSPFRFHPRSLTPHTHFPSLFPHNFIRNFHSAPPLDFPIPVFPHLLLSSSASLHRVSPSSYSLALGLFIPFYYFSSIPHAQILSSPPPVPLPLITSLTLPLFPSSISLFFSSS